MRRRIAKLRYRLWRMGGVDIVVTHAPPEGVGDAQDPAHWGFRALVELLDRYQPKYLLHGHVHLRYGSGNPRLQQYGSTQVINVCERYVLDIPDVEVPQRQKNMLIWKTRPNSHK
jgi:Icc-related predicted phosphoesterase